MRIKKNTINLLIIMALFVAGAWVSVKISSDARIAAFINERNSMCANLSKALNTQENISNCYCYFEGFKTGNDKVDEKTLPLCACECEVNGTRVRVGLVEAR